jgi:glutaredoxin
LNNILHTNRLSASAGLATLAMGLSLLVSAASAQTVYRIVGPDGRVSFSDKPPVTADKASASDVGGKAAASTGAALPFELRQIAGKYPVTLYTSDSCGPCGSGRALLRGRGIPFAEKTVTSSDDIQALQRISGESSLPFLTIGGQQIKGYSDAEWTQFLDAAGYPKSSQLPSGYRNPAAEPLVAVQKPKPAVKADAAPTEPGLPPSPPPIDPRTNPTGIQF